MAKTRKKDNGAPENTGATAIADIDRELLSRRAYERYLARGGEHGQDIDDWLEAERELRNRPNPTNQAR